MNFSNMGAINFAGSTVLPDSREDFGVGDEVAVQGRRQGDGEPDGLVVVNGREFQLGHWPEPVGWASASDG